MLASVLKRVGIVVIGTLLLIGLACVGNSNADTTSVIVASTFTPRPEVEMPLTTPTDVVGSPTVFTPQPVGTREPTPTPGPNEIRPPELILVTPAGRSVGLVSSNAWYDPETETFSGFEFSGQRILAINPIAWPVDAEVRFELQESPIPVGATEIVFYLYDENTATPLNPQGQVIGSDPAFVKRANPVAELDLPGEPLSVEAPVPVGTYIVEVAIHWPVSAEIAQQLPEEAKTQYVFVVVVT